MARRPKSVDHRLSHERGVQLLQISARLFAEKGFRATSMDDIAAEMGLLGGSLYYYVDSKETLLMKTVSSIFELADEAERIASEDATATARLKKLLEAHIVTSSHNPYALTLAVGEGRFLSAENAREITERKATIAAAYSRIINDGTASGEFEVADGQEELAVHFLTGAVSWFLRWYAPTGPMSPEQVASFYLNLALNGLATRTRERVAGDGPSPSPTLSRAF